MTYSDWRVELSEKYKVFKGLYKILKTPGVIKAAPKQKLKNTVGISYKNSMGTLDYRRSIYPDYKANRRNRFARIKATPSGDPMADISQNIYKKEGKRSLERRLAAKEKIRQEWLKANKLPPDSNAQPPGFNEGVASLAIKGSSKVVPALMTGIGAAGMIMQSKKSKGPFADTGGFDASKSRTKRQYLGLPPSSDLTKQQKKNRKIKGQQEIIKKRDDKIAREGPGDLVPGAKRERLKGLIKKYIEKSGIKSKRDVNKKIDRNLGKRVDEDVAAPTNNASSGAIAGLPPDNPPVKKKKRYIYGGTGSRKMWMNNK